MKMVIGGAYQGKTDYAKQAYPNLVWSDGASCDLKDIFSCSGIVHFEEFVRRWIGKTKQSMQRIWQSRFYRKIRI